MSKKLTKITTSELILSAIFYLQQKNGVTVKEITKFICEKRGCPQKHMKENVKKALERATVKGIFSRNRGLYRINNSFGLNKILNNKTKGRGKKTSKGTKAKETVNERKKVFQIRFEEGRRDVPMSLSEMVDERMNDIYDNRGFYIELPGSYEEDDDDDDDEDFEDTEDDEDDTDFFSDDEKEPENTENKNEPKTLFFNKNVDANGSSDCNSLTDPLRKPIKEEYVENDLSEERKDEEMKGQEKEPCDKKIDIPGVGRELNTENVKETDNPTETYQSDKRNQSEDEDQDNEGYAEQHLEEMDWDCQLNDLESIDRLLEGVNSPVDMAEPKDVGSDIAWDKEMKVKKNNSRINLSTEDDPRDSFKANHMNDSTR